jgi:hypothetical protein
LLPSAMKKDDREYGKNGAAVLLVRGTD